MKLIVKPAFERGRTFKYLHRAMQFAEDARARQGGKAGLVVVKALHDQRSYVVGCFGRHVNGGAFSWKWEGNVR